MGRDRRRQLCKSSQHTTCRRCCSKASEDLGKEKTARSSSSHIKVWLKMEPYGVFKEVTQSCTNEDHYQSGYLYKSVSGLMFGFHSSFLIIRVSAPGGAVNKTEITRRRGRRRRSFFRIVRAGGTTPNQLGPARCRAALALNCQPTRPALRPPGACRRPFLAVCPL